jgi:hypothetical protein
MRWIAAHQAVSVRADNLGVLYIGLPLEKSRETSSLISSCAQVRSVRYPTSELRDFDLIIGGPAHEKTGESRRQDAIDRDGRVMNSNSH